MKRKVTIALITLGSGYLLLCVLMFLLQDYILFPGTMRPRRVLEIPRGVEVSRLELADGTSYRVAICKPEQPRAVLAFFVGNGEDLTSGVQWAALFGEYGLHTIVTEYPGYGESGGKVGYQAIMAAAIRSAREAQRFSAAAKLPLFLAGQSLGTFSAVFAAKAGLGDKLLLAAPPTSIAAVASTRYPFLPVRLLLKHPFDNLGKAAGIQHPTLIIHGDADSIVPFAMGRRLAKTFPNATFVTAEGAGHNNLSLHRGGPFGALIERHFFK